MASEEDGGFGDVGVENPFTYQTYCWISKLSFRHGVFAIWSYPIPLPVKQRPGLLQHLRVHLLLSQALRKGGRVCVNLKTHGIQYPGHQDSHLDGAHTIFRGSCSPSLRRGIILVRLVKGGTRNVKDGKPCRERPKEGPRAD